MLTSVLQFGLQLSKRLYQFGSTVSGAKSEIDYIARNVTNFVDTLELLGDRIDDEESTISEGGERIANRLCDESQELFDRIWDLLPDPPRGRDDIGFRQRMAWNFKKSKVDSLAGQVECLKSTTNLLATVLFAGRKIKRYR